jgi:hypothetical protein
MCIHCTVGVLTRQAIDAWAADGLPYEDLVVLARPTAEADPNTYVYVFKGVTLNGVKRDVKVDVHYQGNSISPGASRKAIGGLWMKGVPGAMKPQQHGGRLLTQLQRELPSNAPGIVDGTFGPDIPMPDGVISELDFHKEKVKASGTFLPGRL